VLSSEFLSVKFGGHNIEEFDYKPPTHSHAQVYSGFVRTLHKRWAASEGGKLPHPPSFVISAFRRLRWFYHPRPNSNTSPSTHPKHSCYLGEVIESDRREIASREVSPSGALGE